MKWSLAALRHALHRELSPAEEGPGLIILGIFVGLFTGAGALLFHYLIALLHNLFFSGALEFLL